MLFDNNRPHKSRRVKPTHMISSPRPLLHVPLDPMPLIFLPYLIHSAHRMDEKYFSRSQTLPSALSLIAQVFASTTPASSRFVASWKPAFSRMALTTSLSLTFIWQPYVSIKKVPLHSSRATLGWEAFPSGVVTRLRSSQPVVGKSLMTLSLLR